MEVGDGPLLLRVLVEPAPLAVGGLRVKVERRSSHLTDRRQVISGRVLDAQNDEPVEAMDVVVRNVRGERVGRILTDADGRFFTIVDQAGLYRLAVSRFGYDSTATADVAVSPGQDLYVELRVQPMALGMAPIRVTAPRVIPYIESTGFYSRMKSGQGDYFTADDLQRFPGAFPSHFLRRIPGITVSARGHIQIRGVSSLTGGGCRPRVILDGMPLTNANLDDLVPLSFIDGMEVYKGPATVPPQWRDNATCGVIAVWTRH